MNGLKENTSNTDTDKLCIKYGFFWFFGGHFLIKLVRYSRR